MIKEAELDAQFLIDIVPEYENEIVMEEQFLEEFLPHCIFGIYWKLPCWNNCGMRKKPTRGRWK